MSRHALQRLRDMLVLSSRATLRDSSATPVHALTCRKASQYHASNSLSLSDTSGEETWAPHRLLNELAALMEATVARDWGLLNALL